MPVLELLLRGDCQKLDLVTAPFCGILPCGLWHFGTQIHSYQKLGLSLLQSHWVLIQNLTESAHADLACPEDEQEEKRNAKKEETGS